MERVRLSIHGMVQGVFFRYNTRIQAERLGLDGFVRNTSDGGVEAVAEGPREALEAFVEWCHRGPEIARVDRVDVRWEKAAGEYHGFCVTY